MADDRDMDVQDDDMDDYDLDIDEDPGQKNETQEKKESEEDSDDEDQGRQEDQSSGESSGGTAAGGAVAGAVAAAAVLIFSAISNLNVSFNRVDVVGKNIEYSIDVEMEYDVSKDSNVDWSNADTGLFVVVSNSKELYTKPLITGDEGTEISVTPKSDSSDNTIYKVKLGFNGTFEGLTEHRPYNISVIGDDDGKTKVYCQKDVKTSGPVTEIRGIEGRCTCTIDGKYHFKLLYTDDGNYYQSFAYRLLNDKGEEIVSEIIEDPKKEQEIPDVDQLSGSEFALEILIDSTKPADLEADQFSEQLGADTQLQIDYGKIVLSQKVEF